MDPNLISKHYPPSNYLSAAIKRLPRPGPDVPPQKVVIDAGPNWGRYTVTFVARRNPRQGARGWFWGLQGGERLDVTE